MLTTYTSIFPPICLPSKRYWIPAPVSSTSTNIRSEAEYHALQNIDKFVARVLPGGSRHGALYCVDDGFVALDFTLSPCGNYNLQPGWWRTVDGRYGFDLISLYAEANDTDYDSAAAEIRAAFGGRNSNEQIRAANAFLQELHPLNKQIGEGPLCGWPDPDDVCIIKNAAGKTIATSTRLHVQGSESFETYQTLWRRRNSARSQWLPIFPKKPIFLNRDIMEKYAKAAVWVSSKVFGALEKERCYKDWIHTALPDGPSDIQRADLSFLRGRKIRIELDQAGLENVLKIHKALSEEQNCSVTYTFENLGERDFEGICKVASNHNILVKGLRAEQNKALEQKILISGPGCRIHGSDFDRKMLFHPFLKEGYLVWLYAPEKSGKSWLATSIVNAIATGKGSIGNWSPEQKGGVLLVDGEMQPDELDNIIAQTIRGTGEEYRDRAFAVLCAKSLSSGVIDLKDEFWQNEVEKGLKGNKLLILDNLQSLTRDGGARIDYLQPWLRRINQKGIAILILDHCNAEGDIQGSIAKKRIADVVIKMAPANDEARRNNEVTISYEAGRSLFGKDAEPFVLKRVHGEGTVHYELSENSEGKQVQKVDERTLRMALVVFAKDDCEMTYAQIQEAHNIPRSTAQDLYSASQKLTGSDLEMFKQELQRLRSTKK